MNGINCNAYRSNTVSNKLTCKGIILSKETIDKMIDFHERNNETKKFFLNFRKDFDEETLETIYKIIVKNMSLGETV
jgi:hypothetical protein